MSVSRNTQVKPATVLIAFFTFALTASIAFADHGGPHAMTTQPDQVGLEGKVLKTDGKIAWLQPSSIQVLN